MEREREREQNPGTVARERERAKSRYCSKREGLNGLKYNILFWHSDTVPSHI